MLERLLTNRSRRRLCLPLAICTSTDGRYDAAMRRGVWVHLDRSPTPALRVRRPPKVGVELAPKRCGPADRGYKCGAADDQDERQRLVDLVPRRPVLVELDRVIRDAVVAVLY